MSKKKKTTFAGFPKQTIRFLTDLARNNDREWFARNKQVYEDVVVAPAFEFILAFGPRLLRISRHFRAVAKRSGGSLGRIYKDMRFARGQEPYHTRLALHFRHEASTVALGQKTVPDLRVFIAANGVHISAGLWAPDPVALYRIRQAITTDPARWKRASRSKRLADRLELTGAQLVRVPSGYPQDHPFAGDLRRKQFAVTAEHDVSLCHTPELVDEVEAAFKAAAPFMRFLTETLGAEF